MVQRFTPLLHMENERYAVQVKIRSELVQHV